MRARSSSGAPEDHNRMVARRPQRGSGRGGTALFVASMAALSSAHHVDAQPVRPSVFPPDEAPRSCEIVVRGELYDAPGPAFSRSCFREWGAVVMARRAAQQREESCLRNASLAAESCQARCRSARRSRAGNRTFAMCLEACRDHAPADRCRASARLMFVELLRRRLSEIR